MSGQFSIRNLLIGCAVLALTLGAILKPNLIWSNIILAGVSIIGLLMVVIAIGASGKLRLQAFAFVLVFFTYPFCSGENNNAMWQMMVAYNRVVFGAIEGLGTAEPKRNANDEFVMFDPESKRHTLYVGRSYRNIEESDLQDSHDGFVYTKSRVVGSGHLRNIFNNLSTFFFGALAYCLTGFFYDRREKVEVS